MVENTFVEMTVTRRRGNEIGRRNGGQRDCGGEWLGVGKPAGPVTKGETVAALVADALRPPK